MIHGIDVTLYERTQTGTDAFGAPTWEETPVTVKNVLVAPVSDQDVIDALELYGKKAVYELSLPKKDAHDWRDCRVDFFDQSWRVFGLGKKWIEKNVPLAWNKKVLVERYE